MTDVSILDLLAGRADAGTLERLVVECLRDGEADERIGSLLEILGWSSDFDCFAVGGVAKDNAEAAAETTRRVAANYGAEHVLCGTHDGFSLALVELQGAARPEIIGNQILAAYDPAGAAYFSAVRPGVAGARRAVHEAYYSLKAAPALQDATAGLPAPAAGSGSPSAAGTASPSAAAAAASAVRTPGSSVPGSPTLFRGDDLLPERALLGDEYAKQELIANVFGALKGDNPDDPTYITVSTFLRHGGSLEATARDLIVHPNTVRYRLKRAAETTGWDATDPRDAFVLSTAITLGRIFG